MRIRQQKVISTLKREISNIVHDELMDTRLGFVTIMRVDLTEDLRSAKIYFSVLGGEKEQKDTEKALKRATPFIRSLIGERVKLRYNPELFFRPDRSIEYSVKIQKEIDKIKEKNESEKSD
ncbi:30S ribosome-binding factor RbfA [Candidatus Omnitrophota bacterium]